MNWGTAARILEGIVAVACLFLAGFTYPDERKRLHSKLEDWWIRIDDAAKLGQSKAQATIREFARLTGRGFDLVWGEHVVSARGLSVSICLSMASLMVADTRTIAFESARVEEWRVLSETESAYAVAYVLLVIAQAQLPAFRRLLFPACTAGMVAFMLYQLHGPLFGGPLLDLMASRFPEPEFTAWLLKQEFALAGAILLASCAVDLLFVAWTRRALRWSESLGIWASVGIVLVNGAPVIAAVWYLRRHALLLFINRMNGDPSGKLALFALETNYVDALVAWAFVAVAAAMLAHRLLWGFLARGLHALAAERVVEKKGWLWAIGLGLGADALGGGTARLLLLLTG